MSASPSLAELQRWMRWALTHPLGVGRAAAGESRAGLPDRFREPPARALPALAGDPTASRTVLDRLSVHGDGYLSRLHGTLQLEYPRLAAALGEGGFRALVAAHLLRSPPTSPSLADLGEGLAETLRAQPASARAPWLVDLAALERATAEVWLSDTVDWAQVHLTLSSTTRLVPVDWDITDWPPEGPPPASAEGWLVVWRVGPSTGIEWIPLVPGQLLGQLARGVALGEACALAGTLGMGTEDVAAAFAHWRARGWLARGSRAPAGPGGRTESSGPARGCVTQEGVLDTLWAPTR